MRRNLLPALCGMVLMASSSFAADSVKSLVRISKISKKQVAELIEKGYDVPKTGSGYAELVLDADEIEAFSKKGHPVKYLIKDVDSYITDVKKAQNKTEAYYTYSSMSAKLQEWAKKYPEICKLESIGKTHENRDLWAIKISDNPEKNEDEAAALIMGAHHAREWPSFEVPMAAAQKLLEGYKSDPEMKKLVDSRETWIVPMVNPDGVVYSMEKSKMWRKNRRKNDDGTMGVDLNRNYGYQWGNVGASDWGSSDTYHGTGPLSEPESQAIVKLMKREKFQASISFHTYSELILYPFGYGHNIPNPDEKVFKQMAQDMAKFNGYRPQNSAMLYPAMGDPDDYSYGENKTLAFTFELCKTFIPSPSEIAKFNAGNVPAVMYLIEKAGTYALTTPAGREEIINALDVDGALDAISDNVNLFASEGNASVRNEVLKQLDKISVRAAELVCNDLKSGSNDSWNKVKAMPQAKLAASYVRNRVTFESAHRDGAYSEEVLKSVCTD